MWRALKLETLVWAHMYDDTVHFSESNSATLSIPHPRSLKIEPEIVFGMKKPLAGQDLDAAAALAAVDWLAIGFEIIDCPFPEWKFQPGDFVASFGLHAALVVGEKMEVQPELIRQARRGASAIQGSHFQARRVCGRRLRQELFEESRAVSG